MENKPTRNHARAAGSTILGVSMTDDLKAIIKAAANKEGRTMANFVTYHIVQKLIRDRELADDTPLPLSIVESENKISQSK